MPRHSRGWYEYPVLPDAVFWDNTCSQIRALTVWASSSDSVYANFSTRAALFLICARVTLHEPVREFKHWVHADRPARAVAYVPHVKGERGPESTVAAGSVEYGPAAEAVFLHGEIAIRIPAFFVES
ncbi:hypothetical protein HYPSUDRAFT_33343 [Hypholoma sublateritium FD-334 SS-4]|uniref:Uncharacterized protein n=1 Tax=Hypholoma sublateritium (strain FD-334 SS-4) TaxID=945553 RepID=A0A0D2LLP2_HYPSF|nr:hypothetical protein HYPSUDRAFT_33343 [Hypholoma sublateritium FD-334 SS-4]